MIHRKRFLIKWKTVKTAIFPCKSFAENYNWLWHSGWLMSLWHLWFLPWCPWFILLSSPSTWSTTFFITPVRLCQLALTEAIACFSANSTVTFATLPQIGFQFNGNTHCFHDWLRMLLFHSKCHHGPSSSVSRPYSLLPRPVATDRHCLWAHKVHLQNQLSFLFHVSLGIAIWPYKIFVYLGESNYLWSYVLCSLISFLPNSGEGHVSFPLIWTYSHCNLAASFHLYKVKPLSKCLSTLWHLLSRTFWAKLTNMGSLFQLACTTLSFASGGQPLNKIKLRKTTQYATYADMTFEGTIKTDAMVQLNLVEGLMSM